MDELLKDFLTESNESIEQLDKDLVLLEQDPSNKDVLSSVFRLMHTLKGTCGFLGLSRLEGLAHATENVLGKMREGQLIASSEIMNIVLESIDQIKEILTKIAETGTEPQGDDSALLDALHHTLEPQAPATEDASAAATAASAEIAPVAPEVVSPAPASEPQSKPEESAGASSYVEAALASKVAESGVPTENMPDDQSKKVKSRAAALKKKLRKTKSDKTEEAAPAGSPDITAAAKATDNAEGTNKAPSKDAVLVDQTIRVNVELLENLMTMVSELVLTRNQLMQLLREQKDSSFNVPLQRLSHITSDLQEGVMKTRMQPIGNAWNKLPRLIRDLAQELNKKIELDMQGAETELDRQILELIKDPLTHMVRNAADHGLETPAVRKAAGKPEVGKVSLKAYHEGGHIFLQITDDGKGLPIKKIKEKILANGLATQTEIDQMNEQTIYSYIFKAGFSTAEKVTNVSGRGVGMDVVATNIEKIGGTIEMKTIEGRGTRFTIKIPLTLAIVSALIVEAGGERFAIPQIGILELVGISYHSEHKIEQINNSKLLRLRNRLIPIVSLTDTLKLPPKEQNSRNSSFVVVAQVGYDVFGILVDRVFENQEIVVKPLSSLLRNLSMFSGNTLLGDGRVVMILDIGGISKSVGKFEENIDNNKTEDTKATITDADHLSLLLFKAGDDAPKGVPLGLITRIEEFEVEKIEDVNDSLLIQYRDDLIPLMKIAEEQKLNTEGLQQALVFNDGGNSMGLLIDEIIDIIDDHLDIKLMGEKEGIVGTAIINNATTEIVNTAHYLQKAFPNWFERKEQDPTLMAKEEAYKVLLIDDSSFFRNLFVPALKAANFNVTSVDNAEKALMLLEKGHRFDAIVSDIEMPKIDGFNFAINIRNNSKLYHIPLIALSSRTSFDDLQKGRDSGFDDYVFKRDMAGVIKSITDTIRFKNKINDM